MKENIVFNLVRVQFDINNALKTEYPITDAKQLLELDDALFDFRKDILERCFTGNRFDFNKILPIPDTVYQGDITSYNIDKLTTHERWDYWCVDKWDTEYNAFDEPEWLSCRETHPNYLEFTFKTIRQVPHKIFVALAQQNPDCFIKVDSHSGGIADEGFTYSAGFKKRNPDDVVGDNEIMYGDIVCTHKYTPIEVVGNDETLNARRTFMFKYLKYYHAHEQGLSNTYN